MLVTASNDWGFVVDSYGADGTRPVALAMGPAVTPGNNAYGSYVSLLAGASLTSDCYLVELVFTNWAVSAAAHDTIVTIGLDPTGGSTFTDWITDLIVGPAGGFVSGGGGSGGVSYLFPLFIPAGTSIGVKASQNAASGQSGSAFVRCFGQPTRPETIRVGSRVVSYGSSITTSSGTAVTAGAAADGAYVALGTIAAGDAPWAWVVGMGINNAVVAASGPIYLDLALGSSTSINRQAIQNEQAAANTVECCFHRGVAADCQGAPGDVVYGRMQANISTASGMSMAAYGVI